MDIAGRVFVQNHPWMLDIPERFSADEFIKFIRWYRRQPIKQLFNIQTPSKKAGLLVTALALVHAKKITGNENSFLAKTYRAQRALELKEKIFEQIIRIFKREPEGSQEDETSDFGKLKLRFDRKAIAKEFKPKKAAEEIQFHNLLYMAYLIYGRSLIRRIKRDPSRFEARTSPPPGFAGSGLRLDIPGSTEETRAEIFYNRWVRDSPLEEFVEKVVIPEEVHTPNHLGGHFLLRDDLKGDLKDLSGTQREFYVKTNGTGVITDIVVTGSGYSEVFVWKILTDFQRLGFQSAHFHVDYDDQFDVEGKQTPSYSFFFGEGDKREGMIKSWNRKWRAAGKKSDLVRVVEDSDFDRWLIVVELGEDIDPVRPFPFRIEPNKLMSADERESRKQRRKQLRKEIEEGTTTKLKKFVQLVALLQGESYGVQAQALEDFLNDKKLSDVWRLVKFLKSWFNAIVEFTEPIKNSGSGEHLRLRKAALAALKRIPRPEARAGEHIPAAFWTDIAKFGFKKHEHWAFLAVADNPPFDVSWIFDEPVPFADRKIWRPDDPETPTAELVYGPELLPEFSTNGTHPVLLGLIKRNGIIHPAIIKLFFNRESFGDYQEFLRTGSRPWDKSYINEIRDYQMRTMTGKAGDFYGVVRARENRNIIGYAMPVIIGKDTTLTMLSSLERLEIENSLKAIGFSIQSFLISLMRTRKGKLVVVDAGEQGISNYATFGFFKNKWDLVTTLAGLPPDLTASVNASIQQISQGAMEAKNLAGQLRALVDRLVGNDYAKEKNEILRIINELERRFEARGAAINVWKPWAIPGERLKRHKRDEFAELLDGLNQRNYFNIYEPLADDPAEDRAFFQFDTRGRADREAVYRWSDAEFEEKQGAVQRIIGDRHDFINHLKEVWTGHRKERKFRKGYVFPDNHYTGVFAEPGTYFMPLGVHAFARELRFIQLMAPYVWREIDFNYFADFERHQLLQRKVRANNDLYVEIAHIMFQALDGMEKSERHQKKGKQAVHFLAELLKKEDLFPSTRFVIADKLISLLENISPDSLWSFFGVADNTKLRQYLIALRTSFLSPFQLPSTEEINFKNIRFYYLNLIAWLEELNRFLKKEGHYHLIKGELWAAEPVFK